MAERRIVAVGLVVLIHLLGCSEQARDYNSAGGSSGSLVTGSGGGMGSGGLGGGSNQEPSCADNIKNGKETDVDCGGAECSPCSAGRVCLTTADCLSVKCTANICSCPGESLLISEVKTRGEFGPSDEFIELFNPTLNTIFLDASFRILHRTFRRPGADILAFQGSGQAIEPQRHFLIAGEAYVPGPQPDALLASDVADAGALWLDISGTDTLCFRFTRANLIGGRSICSDGTADNAPHDNTSAGNIDMSLERKPGGMAGGCTDTNSPNDFTQARPSTPQNSGM